MAGTKTKVGILIHLREVNDFRLYLNKIKIEAASLGANLMIVIDETQYKVAQYFNPLDIKVYKFDTLDQAEKKFKSIKKVYLEPQRVMGKYKSQSLPDFDHPKSCIYITGPDAGTIPIKSRDRQKWVHIPVSIDKGIFYAETALILTLYDRLTKI